jgi:hypothetical protein
MIRCVGIDATGVERQRRARDAAGSEHGDVRSKIELARYLDYGQRHHLKTAPSRSNGARLQRRRRVVLGNVAAVTIASVANQQPHALQNQQRGA